jgi:hypothetical protein
MPPPAADTDHWFPSRFHPLAPARASASSSSSSSRGAQSPPHCAASGEGSGTRDLAFQVLVGGAGAAERDLALSRSRAGIRGETCNT